MANPSGLDTARRDSGFALLIVLWTMSLLALLAAQVTGAGRAETRLAAAQREGAQLQAAADAAIYETVWHMLPGSGDWWTPGAIERDLPEAGGLVHVSVTDERGKLDLNQAPPQLMQAFLQLLGLDTKSAAALANSINEWRTDGPGNDPAENVPPEYRAEGYAWGPPGQEFETIPELLLVRGMTQAIYEAMRPYVTLDLEQGPWLQYAPPIVLAAMDKAKREGGLQVDQPDARGPVVLRMTASVRGPGGAAFTRRVMLRIDGTLGGSGSKYRFLEWESGSA